MRSRFYAGKCLSLSSIVSENGYALPYRLCSCLASDTYTYAYGNVQFLRHNHSGIFTLFRMGDSIGVVLCILA